MSSLPADLQLYEETPADVEILVPERRQYGIVQRGGKQIVYTARELGGGRFAIRVPPEDAPRILRAIEGSKLANVGAAADQLRPELVAAGAETATPEPSVRVARKSR